MKKIIKDHQKNFLIVAVLVFVVSTFLFYKGTKDRMIQNEEEKVEIGEIIIFPDLYEVQVRGEIIDITPKEFELLLYMAKRANRILSREQLLNAIWNFDYAGETRIVDVHISHLREKIEENTKKPVYIKTVRGFGYKFEEPK